MAGIYVNTNIPALDTHIRLSQAQDSLQTSLKKLSSGLRITGAADDASGLAISEKLRTQVKGLDRAALNSQDAISLLQTAEGALDTVHGILQRMRELAVQAANETLTATDRVEIQKEIEQLKGEIDRISRTTEFNTKKLLNGDATVVWTSDKIGIEVIARDVAKDFGTHLVKINGSGGQVQVQESNIFRTAGATAAATSTTQLQNLANFYDPDGNFILATPKKLTVWNGSKSVDIQLEATMTLSDVATKIQSAMETLGLSGSQVRYVSSTGTLVVASGVVGKAGEVFFSGDEDVMKAFGFTVRQAGVDPTLTVKVFNGTSSTSGTLATANIATNTARNIVQGIDLKFTQLNVGVSVSVTILSSANGTVSASITTTTSSFTIHLVDHSLTFHIGANKNQTMNMAIGRIDTVSLGIDNLLVVDKTAAEEAIKKLDSAIAIVSSERGKMGAVINRLQKTIDNLNIQKENMSASESRIRDLDMAAETTKFTKSQILSQTAIAMLAQANAIPQMVLQLLR